MIWFPKKNGGNSSEESESGPSPSYPSHSQPDFNLSPADNSTNPSITAADQASGRPVPTSGTANPASGSSSVDCLSRIENVISSKGRGVVMKLYLENFKRLNQVLAITTASSSCLRSSNIWKKRQNIRYIAISV